MQSTMNGLEADEKLVDIKGINRYSRALVKEVLARLPSRLIGFHYVTQKEKQLDHLIIALREIHRRHPFEVISVELRFEEAEDGRGKDQTTGS